MTKIKSAVTALLLFSCLGSMAQVDGDIYRKQSGPAVKFGSGQLPLAWSGGMNNPQFTMGDLNQDGIQDLVVYEHLFDVQTFIGTGTGSYKYNPKYESNFPLMAGYVKLVDYNSDNVPDLIHRGNGGYSLSKGYYDNKELKFTYYRDLYYMSQVTGWTNAYVEPNVDIPMVVDIDKDGDVDFLSYDVYGARILFYRNCRIEDGLPPDSVRICLKDLCWGRTKQLIDREQILGSLCTTNQNIFSTCKGCGSSNKTTHTGNTLCAFDADGDGDYDYLNGNISYSDIQFLKNGKTDYSLTVDSIISQDTIWGSNGKDMVVKNYPAAFWLDIDNDTDKDLLFAPHDPYTENKKVLFYENKGSDSSPNFVYQTDQYIIQEAIDIGSGSYPVFYDYDKDGKKDLFIGSDGYYQSSTGTMKSKVSYFKNTSSETTVSFELITDDFLSLEANNYVGIAMAIGDIDGDTLDDMIIGKTDGTIAVYINKAADNTVQPDWQLATPSLMLLGSLDPFDAGDYAAPCIYDIDKDGDNDIIIGNQTGDLIHLKNNSSSPGSIAFLKGSDNLGGVKVLETGQVYGYTAPYIGPMDNSGVDYLMVGTQSGYIHRYTGFQSGDITTPFVRVDSQYSYVDVHERATPAFANVDNSSDGLFELVVGNYLGGVNYYTQANPVNVKYLAAERTDVKVYPNPSKDVLNITWGTGFASGKEVQIKLISVTGQELASTVYKGSNTTTKINVSAMPQGMYYCIVSSANNKTVKPVVILR